jgi:hypothetical protein
MALRVWLPFLGDAQNKGISNVAIDTTNLTFNNNGKLGKCAEASLSVNLNIP